MVADTFPEWVETTHEIVVKTLTPLVNDSVPQIQVQACHALVNVFEGLPDDIIEEHSVA